MISGIYLWYITNYIETKHIRKITLAADGRQTLIEIKTKPDSFRGIQEFIDFKNKKN